MHCAIEAAKYNPRCEHCFNCVCNCSCLHVHSEQGDALRPSFDITFIVIGAVAGAAALIVLVTVLGTAMATFACILKGPRFAIT